MEDAVFFDRDLSWLSFNERILQEAARETVPLLERINFLAIYSSNLDEFYRVRMPALMLATFIKPAKGYRQFHTTPQTLYCEAVKTIASQLDQYGRALTHQIIPSLKQHGIYLVYKEAIPYAVKQQAREYFYTQLLSFIQKINVAADKSFFPENSKLYIAVVLQQSASEEIFVVPIPSDKLPRFIAFKEAGVHYIIFIDDIIRENLHHIFPGAFIKETSAFKLNRDAELNLHDEYEGDIAEKIETSVNKRDLGFATRFLYEPSISLSALQCILSAFNMHHASVVQGGTYHNLRDFFKFPVKDAALAYSKWPQVNLKQSLSENFFAEIAEKDLIIHTPYHNYNMVLRFFNEAAADPLIAEIYTTMYRVAGDSKIANALISAAKNGKKVSVFVELKARFDETNNIKWSKLMKEAGVKIIYSIPSLKVHAKVALLKKKNAYGTVNYYGLLSTGNLNESTAKLYTDHILFTAHTEITRELELLFIFLSYRRKPFSADEIKFKQLLVAQFNLQQHFISLIDREIAHAKAGKVASVIIKLNNLEERILISKLYEASAAGVHIQMIVRSICCLVPGMPGISENISVKRIVDRYLEHGRVFIFHNNGCNNMYLGSADWMNRNIYSRIEVCFPVHDEAIKKEVMQIIEYQLNDNVQTVHINNTPAISSQEKIKSQSVIQQFIAAKEKLL